VTVPPTSAAATGQFHHVGVTVPSIARATEFFAAVLDANVLYDVPLAAYDDKPVPEVEPLSARMGFPAGSRIKAIRMLEVAHVRLELFEFEEETQQAAARPCDLGMQHLAFYVENIHRTVERVQAAGGRAFAGPGTVANPFFGNGHLWWYCVAPWGSIIELLCAKAQL